MAMEMSHGGDTKMLKVYYHVTHDEVEQRVLSMKGIGSEPVRKMPSAQVCPACHVKNPTTVKFCGTCGSILDPEKYQASVSAATAETATLKKQISEMSAALDQVMLMIGAEKVKGTLKK
jgi:hypothetical protein